MARCLLIEVKLHKTLWTYAVMTAVYIRDRCYNHKIKKTPHEAFTKQKPNLQNMHILAQFVTHMCRTRRNWMPEEKKNFS